MRSQALAALAQEAPLAIASRLAQVVLVRIAAGEATGGQIVRDLRPLVAGTVADVAVASEIMQLIVALATEDLAIAEAGVVRATESGRTAAAAVLGLRKSAQFDWPAARDGHLVALALGLEGAPASRQKALVKLDALRAVVVLQHWKLKLRGKPSASRVRSGLALVALERAFGNQIKTEIGQKSGLSAKAARLLAGQLAKKPRDFGTDSRLVAALAAEAVGATRSDLGALRLGVLRQFLRRESQRPPRPVAAPTRAMTPAAVPASALSPHPSVVVALPVAAPLSHARPDPAAFVRVVKAIAAERAEGWAGNRRAFVSRVWALVRERYALWDLSEIEFKAMLAEAHRTGLLVLANADLKDKITLADVQASAVSWKNTVWHYIRVET